MLKRLATCLSIAAVRGGSGSDNLRYRLAVRNVTGRELIASSRLGVYVSSDTDVAPEADLQPLLAACHVPHVSLWLTGLSGASLGSVWGVVSYSMKV